MPTLHLKVYRDMKRLYYLTLGLSEDDWKKGEEARIKAMKEAPDYGDEPYGA